ncbi:hypothetical protein [Chryseobacterium polytrichastri]|uniref:hypothetical protein n=1 Tax=Chryseobacterium polytrichastri TaxID=1302687 RepID=UPI001114CE1C|nr:hypothetical protein [Chryseobacterium polytrichastri]
MEMSSRYMDWVMRSSAPIPELDFYVVEESVYHIQIRVFLKKEGRKSRLREKREGSLPIYYSRRNDILFL